MSELNEEEVFETKPKKEKSQILKNIAQKIANNKKKSIIICCAIIIVIILIVLFSTGTFSNILNKNKIGNSIGNITNCGYSVENGKYIYFVSPSEDMLTTTISRFEVGTDKPEVIYSGAYDIRALNIVGNKIYFINLSVPKNSDDQSNSNQIDAKICRMNLDGSKYEVLNDNDFAYDDYNMYVANNEIYYIGTDKNVYKMDLKGGNRQLVAETHNSILAMDNNYIIYNKENADGSDYITYISNLEGSNEREINSGRIYNPIIYEGNIYYINKDNKYVKSPIEGGDEQVVVDSSVYNPNIYNGYLYYLNYKDEKNQDYTIVVYRLNLAGGEPEVLKEMETYSSFINLVKGCVYYMDMNDEKAFINLINVDTKEETQLNEWNYNQK